MHRVRVGMTGLASVLVLIGLASAVFNSASDDPASNATVTQTLENRALGNDAEANEPLAEIGVAPTVTTNAN
jgi:hypothetical protein